MLSEDDMAEDLTDGIFGAARYEAELPTKRNFLPWHQPRKQFIRDRQWVGAINDLLQELEIEGPLLRYLGLPGDDLLDLRVFHERVCQPRNLRLRFLGFNTAAAPSSRSHTDLNISYDEIMKLDLVDTSSDIIADDFRQISNENSMAWKKARDLGPYDVINLDFCDGFTSHAPGAGGGTHYNAVSRLLALQARRKNPWVLLLTTRVGREHIDPRTLELMFELYARNLSECKPFRERSFEEFSIADPETLRDALSREDGCLSIALVGLVKWLLSLGLAQSPPTVVKLASLLCYRVRPEASHHDLASFAFRFQPTFASGTDPAGFAGGSIDHPSECDLADKALYRVAKRGDADEILAADPDLFESMVVATMALLDTARYDVSGYREWLSAT